MKISPSGKKWTAEAEFGEFVAAIVRYTPADELEAIEWYCAAALCRDELCRLPISDFRELADFLSAHQSEIVGTIATASA
jgi:hypothetical protein